MDKIRVISVYPNFSNRGGAQDVALQLAEKLNEGGTLPIVLTGTIGERIVPEYKCRADFRPFGWKWVRKLADGHTLFLSHHRKYTSLLLLFKLWFEKKLIVVHVAHNTFDNMRLFSYFPRQVVAVSHGVKKNLVDYFHVPASRICVIFNGIKDSRHDRNRKPDGEDIHILLPGRVCPVKQQVEIVKQTAGKLAPHVHIHFAGRGEDEERLKEAIKGWTNFHYEGFIDITKNLGRYDYVCLFSKNEGLPLSLIEGLMFGKPLLTNDIPAVLDVNKAGETGFVFPDFTSLVKGLNELPRPDSEEYRYLSHNARLGYEHHFTEENMIIQYKCMIRKVMTQNGMLQFTSPINSN